MNIEKIIFFEILIILSKCQLVCTLQIFVDALSQKLVSISKPNFTSSFGSLRLRADSIFGKYRPKIKKRGVKFKIIIYSN